ncbi:hypothetical protein BH18ACT10_BH18ACT10_05920 [soil metagenome]|nr:hypothetical protein [Rubrobacter sp.]
MNLEIKGIYSADVDDYPDDPHNFVVHLYVDVGEAGREGAETFNFFAASPGGLAPLVKWEDYYFLRGYILMDEFDWKIIHRAIQNLIDHARSRQNLNEVMSFFNRYGLYDSKDLGGRHYP